MLLSIVQHYAKSGQMNKDSMRKYDLELLDLLKNEAPSAFRAKAKAYLMIAEFRAPFEKYAVLAKDLIEDYKVLGNYKGVIKEQYYLANKAHTAGEASSFQLYQEGIHLLEQHKEELDPTDYCRLSTRYLASTASNFDYVGLYDDAIEMVLQAVEKAESCQDSTSRLYAYVPAGAIIGAALENVNLNLEKWPNLEEQLLSYLTQTNSLAIALNKNVTAALAAYNLGHYYYSKNHLDKAQEYLQQSWEVEGIEWMTRQMYLNYGLEADILSKRGDHQSAYASLEKSYDSAVQLNEPLFLFEAQLELAKWHINQNQLGQASKFLNGLDTMLLDNLEKRRDYYKVSSELAIKNQKPTKAYSALTQYHLYKDSINNSATSQHITALLAKYDLTVAENKITELEAESAKTKFEFQKKVSIGIILISLLLAAGIIFYFLSKQRLLRSEQENQEIQQKLFRAQMNPHFIFNTLGSIQSFLLNKGKAQDAAYFLTKFAKLMRQILSQSQQTFISLEEEVDTLNHYLLLQRMRFEGRFDYSIDVQPTLDMIDTQVPPMILQPIIENAIEHGKIYNQADGVVSIGIELLDDCVSIKVKDNGLGKEHKESIPIKKKEKSFSLSIIRQRLQLVSRQFGKIAQMTMSEVSTGGTIVHVLLPHVTRASL